MSDTTDLILMKVGGLIRAVFWHLTFLILIGWMGTLQYNKLSHFQGLKGHNCHSCRSDFDEMLKDDATCSFMAKGLFVLFMRYSMFTYISSNVLLFLLIYFWNMHFSSHFWHNLFVTCYMNYSFLHFTLFFFLQGIPQQRGSRRWFMTPPWWPSLTTTPLALSRPFISPIMAS